MSEMSDAITEFDDIIREAKINVSVENRNSFFAGYKDGIKVIKIIKKRHSLTDVVVSMMISMNEICLSSKINTYDYFNVGVALGYILGILPKKGYLVLGYDSYFETGLENPNFVKHYLNIIIKLRHIQDFDLKLFIKRFKRFGKTRRKLTPLALEGFTYLLSECKRV